MKRGNIIMPLFIRKLQGIGQLEKDIIQRKHKRQIGMTGEINSKDSEKHK